jgi:hypothetical protein
MNRLINTVKWETTNAQGDVKVRDKALIGKVLESWNNGIVVKRIEKRSFAISLFTASDPAWAGGRNRGRDAAPTALRRDGTPEISQGFRDIPRYAYVGL